MTNPFPGREIVTADATTKALPTSVVAKLAVDLGSQATLNSPAFTGTPTAPTAAPGTNTTQVATTAFTSAAVGAVTKATIGLANVDNTTDLAKPISTAQATVNTALTAADLTKAPLNSPAFTGTPTGITAAHVGALATSTRGAVSGVASLDASGHHATAELNPGQMIQLRYYSSAWHDPSGNVITARPSARTDIAYCLVAPAGTAKPAWVIAWDRYETF